MKRRQFLASLAVGTGTLAGCASIPRDSGNNGSSIASEVDVAERIEATVTDVVDGDTLDVRYGGESDRVRLLGVDTPEVHAEVSPDEFPGVPDTRAGRQWLGEWGQRASDFATETVGGADVTLVVDAQSDRRGSYDRLLAYVYAGEESLNRQLIADGYACVYPSEFSLRAEFDRVEQRARDDGVGVWGFDGGGGTDEADGVRIAEIHADASGDDRENLNGEYAVIENGRASAVELSGWRLADDAGHVYRFPDGYTLAEGGDVTVRTGAGENSDDVLYWGADAPVWNNSGDTGVLRNAAGETMDRLSY